MHGLWLTVIAYGAALAFGVARGGADRTALRAHPAAFGLLALTAGFCNAAFILAVLEGPVFRVLLLFYLSPLWAVLLGWMVLGERPTVHGALVVAAALAGAVVMLWSPGMDWPWPRTHAEWLAIGSGFTFAVSNVVLRGLAGTPLLVKTTVAWAGGIVVALAWIAFGVAASVPADPVAIGGALLVGLPGFVVMTLALQYGVTQLPLQRSSVILLFELVVGAVSASVWAGESITPGEWIGGALVVLAAWAAAREEEG